MPRSRLSLEDTRVGNDGGLASGTGARSDLLESVDDVGTFDDLAEDDVSSVEPWSRLEGDEELRAVGVGAGVGHGQEVGLRVGELEVLVVELVAVDGLAASAVSVGEVATLGHEAGDNAVEFAALEVERLARVASAGGSVSKRGEVGGGLRDDVAEHAEDDSASFLTIDLNVEEDLLGDFGEGLGKGGREKSGQESKNFHFEI